MPTLFLECAFGTLPPAVPTTWTRLDNNGNRLEAWSTRRGTQQVSGDAEPGEATFRISNANGNLDPENASGPYYGNLVPGTPIRLRYNDGVGTVELFRGFVESWPVTWHATWSSVEVRAYDALGWLAQQPIERSAFRVAIKAQSPIAYWPMDDPLVRTIPDEIRHWGAVLNADTTLNESALLPYDPGLNVGGKSTGTLYKRAEVGGAVFPVTGSWTVVMIVSVSENNNVFLSADGGASGFLTMGVELGPPPDLFVRTNSVAGTAGAAYAPASGTWDDRQARLIAATFDGTTLRLNVNGTTVASAAATGKAPTAINTVTFGSATPQETFVGHVAIFDKFLGAAAISAFYSAGFQARHGDLSGTRIGYLLDRASWPAGLRSVEAGREQTGRAILDKSLLELLRETVGIEDGRIDALTSGVVRFRQRRITGPAVRLFDIGDGTAHPTEEPAMALTEEDYFSSVTIDGEAPARFTQTGTKAGVREGRVTTGDFPNSADAWRRAERAVWQSLLGKMRASKVTIRPSMIGMARNNIAADLGSAVGLFQRRPWGTTSGDFVIDGIEHRGRDHLGTWEMDWYLRPAPPRRMRLHAPSGANATGAITDDATGIEAITGDLDVRVRFHPLAWGNAGALVARRGALVGTWMLYLDPRPTFGWWDSGSTFRSVQGQRFDLGGLRPIWLRATLDLRATDSVATLYISDDGVAWTTLASATVASTTLRSSADDTTIGYQVDNDPTYGFYKLGARFYEAQVYSGIGGVLTGEFNPSRDASGPGATSLVSATTGETWTINTAAGGGIEDW